jgi:hypothetical protein
MQMYRQRIVALLVTPILLLGITDPRAAAQELGPLGLCPADVMLDGAPDPDCQIPIFVSEGYGIDEPLELAVTENLGRLIVQQVDTDGGLIAPETSIFTTPVIVDLRGFDIRTVAITDPSTTDESWFAILDDDTLAFPTCQLAAYDREEMEPAPPLERTSETLPGFPEEVLGEWTLDLDLQLHQACPWKTVTGGSMITRSDTAGWNGVVESGTYDESEQRLSFVAEYTGYGDFEGQGFREVVKAIGYERLDAALEWLPE